MEQLCIQNCGQTAADKNIDTTYSLKKLVLAPSNGTIADALGHTV